MQIYPYRFNHYIMLFSKVLVKKEKKLNNFVNSWYQYYIFLFISILFRNVIWNTNKRRDKPTSTELSVNRSDFKKEQMIIMLTLVCAGRHVTYNILVSAPIGSLIILFFVFPWYILEIIVIIICKFHLFKFYIFYLVTLYG